MAHLTTQLYVVRHAVAEDLAEDGTDFSRRLTKKGRKRFEKLVEQLAGDGMEIDLIATSPLVRTRETAEILADVLGGKRKRPPVEVVEPLAPSSNWEAVVEWTVRQGAGSVAWVGHAPCVGRLIAMTIGDGTASIRMQKGAIASIRLDDGPGQPGDLEWLVTPDIFGS